MTEENLTAIFSPQAHMASQMDDGGPILYVGRDGIPVVPFLDSGANIPILKDVRALQAATLHTVELLALAVQSGRITSSAGVDVLLMIQSSVFRL